MVITTHHYWDCDCTTNYIRPSKQHWCRRCGARKREQPDAHVSEAIMAGKLTMQTMSLRINQRVDPQQVIVQDLSAETDEEFVAKAAMSGRVVYTLSTTLMLGAHLTRGVWFPPSTRLFAMDKDYGAVISIVPFCPDWRTT